MEGTCSSELEQSCYFFLERRELYEKIFGNTKIKCETKTNKKQNCEIFYSWWHQILPQIPNDLDVSKARAHSCDQASHRAYPVLDEISTEKNMLFLLPTYMYVVVVTNTNSRIGGQ